MSPTLRPTTDTLPRGPVPIATGTARLEIDRHDPTGVLLYVNEAPSSFVDLADPRRLEFEYMQWMVAVLAEWLPDRPLRAVHLGAAGCALARALDAERPGSRQLAVEIDADLAAAVRGWFDLPRAPRLRIRVGEAAEVLASRPAASAEVVVRDVFAGRSTPRHLTTLDFLAEASRVLAPGGVYLANCADDTTMALARAEAAALREVFDEPTVVAEPAQFKGRRWGNFVLCGRRREQPVEAGGAVAGRAVRGGRRGAEETDDGLDRRLRRLPVPARRLRGTELERFVGRTRPPSDRTG